MSRALTAVVVTVYASLGTFAQAGELTVTAAINVAKRQDVIVVGETHDNPIHHFVQKEFSATIQPIAIVYEMIEQQDEIRLNELRHDGATREALEKALNWDTAGWPAFAHYAQIMEVAPNAQIYGAALPREKVRAAVADGAATVFGDQAARFGLDKPLPPDQQSDREAIQMTAHCDALPTEMLSGMVEAQRLRDAALAAAVIRAKNATGENGAILVITGNGHADLLQGAPAALAQAAPHLTVFSFAQLEAEPDGPVPYDAYHITLPTKRDDPCAAFSKS